MRARSRCARAGLFAGSAALFAAVESTIHWSAGYGFHPQHCLSGPVHENAIPILAAIAVVASVAIAVGDRLAAWARRTLRSAVVVHAAPISFPAPAAVSLGWLPVVATAPLGGRTARSTRFPLNRGHAVHEPLHPFSRSRHGTNHLARCGRARRRRALALPAVASAHASVSPPTVVKDQGQLFAVAVPGEEENDTTTTVEVDFPAGFGVDSFEAEPGWTRTVKATGSGEEADIQSATWTGGKVPTGEDAVFRFVGRAGRVG